MKIEKVEKLVARFFDKNELVIHIRNFKQALNHGLVLKKVHRVIESQQKEEETDVRIKLPYYIFFRENLLAIEMKKNSNIHE